MNRKYKRSQQGFTLVEVMIAGSIFVMISLGFTAAYITAMRTHRMAANLYNATLLAKNQMQRARSLNYNNLGLMAEDKAKLDAQGNVNAVGPYQRTTTVDTNQVKNCSLVRVQVWYPDTHGRLATSAVEVATLITDAM